MKIIKYASIGTLSVLIGCGDSNDQSEKKDALIKQSALENQAFGLAEANAKGHMLGVLMRAIQFSNELKSHPLSTRQGERERAMFIDRSTAGPLDLRFDALPKALLSLRTLEQRKFDSAWKEYWAAQAHWSPDSNPEYTLNTYLKLLEDQGPFPALVALSAPFKCRHLPTQFTRVTDWRECLTEVDLGSKDLLLGAGQYGATLAQAIFYKERNPVAEFGAPDTEPIIHRHFEDFRRRVAKPDAQGTPLSEAEREQLLGAWLEVSPRGDAVAEILDTTAFKRILAERSVTEISGWLAQELAQLKATIANLPAKDARPLAGTVQTLTSLDEYRTRADFTLGTVLKIRFHARDELNVLEDDLRRDPEYFARLGRFSTTLVNGLVEYWNGHVGRDELIRNALAELPNSETKRLLERKISGAVEIADEPAR